MKCEAGVLVRRGRTRYEEGEEIKEEGDLCSICPFERYGLRDGGGCDDDDDGAIVPALAGFCCYEMVTE